jgi:hypothetical protein
MGLIGCPETSVGNYHYLLHKKPRKAQFSKTINISLIFFNNQVAIPGGNT